MDVSSTSCDDENCDTEDDYDVWENINNDKLDDENVSGTARTNRSLALVLYLMKCGFAWRREHLYKTIMVKVRKVRLNKDMTFQEALKYAIRQEIRNSRKACPGRTQN